jgi:hypothetical protein
MSGLPHRCYYKKQNFVNAAYGADMMSTWFGEAKPSLVGLNSCMNLPYILDGKNTVTQSNTCMLFLGQKLGLDTFGDFIDNHTVLDQVMDLRNDLMKLVYMAGFDMAAVAAARADLTAFNEAAAAHLAGTTKTNFTKLEGFCKGTFMCGEAPQVPNTLLLPELIRLNLPHPTLPVRRLRPLGDDRPAPVHRLRHRRRRHPRRLPEGTYPSSYSTTTPTLTSPTARSYLPSSYSTTTPTL